MIKRFFIYFLPLPILLGVILGLVYYSERKSEKVSFETKEAELVKLHNHAITDSFRHIVSDLMFLSDQYELRSLLDKYEYTAPESLIKNYISFSARKGLYDQIRFVALNGIEIIRINYNGGDPSVTPNDRLQFKGDRYYFKETFALNRGEIFVSPMDLNVENGTVERPLKPVIRFGTPVFDSEGKKRGVIILNYLAKLLIEGIRRVEGVKEGTVYLLNSDGYWLINPNTDFEWGFMFKDRRDRTIQNSFPDIHKKIMGRESGQFYTKDGLFTFTTVHPLLMAQKLAGGAGQMVEEGTRPNDLTKYSWKILYRLDKDRLHERSYTLLTKLIPLYAVLFVVAAAGSLVLASATMRRIESEFHVKRMALFAEINPDPMFRCDENSLIKFANPAAVETLGIKENGRTRLDEILPTIEIGDLKEFIRDNSILYHVDFIGGRFYHFVAKGSKGMQRINFYGSDITDLKKAEEELRKAKEHAEKATKLKDKFVSLVSHDLRSPFHSILGFLKIMLSDVEDPLSEKHKTIVKNIIGTSENMVEVINKLLDISRLKTGKIVPKMKFFDARITSSLAFIGLQHLAEAKNIELVNELPKGTRIYADPDLFGEVVQNLVSNSIKFTNNGGQVTVFIPHDEKCTVAVKDTGIGVDENIIPKLFLHEYKTTSTGTAGEIGTGLGLPLCNDIMSAHRGKLVAESKPGGGSVFYARLPNAKPLALVVEDSKIVRRHLEGLLESIDVDFLYAEHGGIALDLLKEKSPHLIIIDIFMPVMGGFELMSRLKKNPETASIPVVVITADEKVETRDRAYQLGAVDFITKPVEEYDFIPRIRRLVI